MGYIEGRREKGLHAIKLSIPSCLNLLERRLCSVSAHSPRAGREVKEEVEDTPLFKCFRSPSPSILPSGGNSPPVEFYSTLSLIQVCAYTYPRFELPLFAEDVKHGDWGTRARRRILNYSCLCIVLIWEFEILFLKIRGKVLSGVLSG